jgi:hypothetical protein
LSAHGECEEWSFLQETVKQRRWKELQEEEEQRREIKHVYNIKRWQGGPDETRKNRPE